MCLIGKFPWTSSLSPSIRCWPWGHRSEGTWGSWLGRVASTRPGTWGAGDGCHWANHPFLFFLHLHPPHHHSPLPLTFHLYQEDYFRLSDLRSLWKVLRLVVWVRRRQWWPWRRRLTSWCWPKASCGISEVWPAIMQFSWYLFLMKQNWSVWSANQWLRHQGKTVLSSLPNNSPGFSRD